MEIDTADTVVGIVGAGAMGQGIAQVAAAGGMRTLIHDAAEGAARRAVERVGERIDRLAEKGRLAPEEAAAAKARLEAVDGIAALAPCRVVVEAVVEDLAVKQSVFRDLEAVVAPDAILATNTSSIPIGAIARALDRPGRVAGMHFFNPVPLMKLVEVIEGPDTDPAVADTLVALGRAMTRVPVKATDAPGFLVNFGGRAFTTEGLMLAHEGVASPAEIDAILRDGCGFRMGPFELMDLTGMDVNYPVTATVHAGYMYDPRLRTAPLHKLLFESGRLGRKTGAGHFRYDEAGAKIDPPSPDLAPEGPPADRLVLAEPTDALRAFAGGLGATVVEADDGTSPILAYPVGEDATAFAVRTGTDHRRLVAVDLSAALDKRVTLMTAPGAAPDALHGVAGAVAATGRAVTAIKDSPGFVALRMRAFIANLGCSMAETGLAGPDEIDLALKLGLNYPQGPLEMAADLGLATTLAVMERLQAITGDDRYRPAGWLRRRALLDLPIDAPA